MRQSIQELLQTRGGVIAGSTAFVIVMAILLVSLLNSFSASRAGAHSRDRLFICAETGLTFRHELNLGDTIPVNSPHSGHDTGFEAERCYWTADGQVAPEPTPVLLGAYVGETGPTFCPDCDRLVVRWNPRPRPGQTPPPTRGQLQRNPRALQAAARLGND